MKARRPKEWDELSPGARKKLEDHMLSILNEAEEKDMRIVIELLIKMLCILLHDTGGYGEKRLTLLVGNLNMMFKEQKRLVSKGKQREWLDKRLAKIFRRDGFPQYFIDGMFGKADEDALKGRTEIKL